MNDPIVGFAWTGIVVTPWKLIGITGALMFGARWVVQFFASRRAGKPVIPRLFWYMSLAGSTMALSYFLFSNSVHRVAESINGNKSLLYYPQVQPLDLVTARSLLEAATFGTVFLALMGAHALVRQELVIDSPLRTIAGMALASGLGTALGLIFCCLGQLSPAADRARGPMLRPLFWISGIFFTAESLPERARDAMLLNPVLHTTEMVRDGWFVDYTDDHTDVLYVVAWVLGLVLVGLLLERHVRRKIEMS